MPTEVIYTLALEKTSKPLKNHEELLKTENKNAM